MEALAWRLRTLSGFTSSVPIIESLLILLVLCWDYLFLLPRHLWRRTVAAPASRLPADPSDVLPALVVIPSLLRSRDELTSMMATVTSVATNGYRGRLYIVVSIDGYSAAPGLYAELQSWAARQSWNDHHWLHVTGTDKRRGKPLAIEHGVAHLKNLVARGVHPEFPPVYVSTDADADLGPLALEHLVARLRRRHPITGWPARAVAGNLYIRGNDFWRGWRHFFSVEGQLRIQVAREYMVTNVARHNLRWMPLSGVPGVLYCTWSEIILAAPGFLGYIRTLTARDWLKWWLGWPAPKFSETTAAPIPELVAGDTDDTVSAYMAIVARWDHGRFTFDPPRTPAHAFVHLLQAVFLDRALRYEPEARVYTSSPTTVKALFKQRKRWNCSRIEVTGRFWSAMRFHWSLGLPAVGILALMAKYIAVGGLLYFSLPMALFKSSVLAAFVFGFVCQLAGYGMLTILALILNGELRLARVLAALPLSPLYAICFTYAPSVVGGISDVCLFGNVTGFAPEWTLIAGGSSRVALAFRLRRAFLLAVRSVVRGDVPWGAFWFGWNRTAWSPNGFEGWTTGKRPQSIVPPVSTWFRHRDPGQGGFP